MIATLHEVDGLELEELEAALEAPEAPRPPAEVDAPREWSFRRRVACASRTDIHVGRFPELPLFDSARWRSRKELHERLLASLSGGRDAPGQRRLT